VLRNTTTTHIFPCRVVWGDVADDERRSKDDDISPQLSAKVIRYSIINAQLKSD
jgi:hypothetical protein